MPSSIVRAIVFVGLLIGATPLSAQTRDNDPVPGWQQQLKDLEERNAKASYSIIKGLDAELSGSNLFDRNYQLYPGFPEAGRIVAVNLRYRY